MERSFLSALLASSVLVLAVAPSARADEPAASPTVAQNAVPSSTVAQTTTPSGGSGAKGNTDRWWENPPVEKRDNATRVTLLAVGGGLAGLGALAMLGSGITWLVAAGESLALDDECYDKLCYEDSRGGEALERARDAERGAGITFGIGLPVMTAGFVMMLFGAGMGSQRSLEFSPTVGADGTGGLSVRGQF